MRAWRYARLFLVVSAGLLAVAFLLDWASLRFRFPNHREQFGMVRVQPLLAVPLKNGKTEFILGDAEDRRCSESWFPHAGYAPCWYLNRHKKQQVDM